jgi:hypothetical protein
MKPKTAKCTSLRLGFGSNSCHSSLSDSDIAAPHILTQCREAELLVELHRFGHRVDAQRIGPQLVLGHQDLLDQRRLRPPRDGQNAPKPFRAHIGQQCFANKDLVEGFASKFRPLVMTQEVKLLQAAPWGPHP